MIVLINILLLLFIFFFFFFNDTATTEIYTLSLHDALPICEANVNVIASKLAFTALSSVELSIPSRSEEHTSELQSQSNLVCRLLLEKKKKQKYIYNHDIIINKTYYSTLVNTILTSSSFQLL